MSGICESCHLRPATHVLEFGDTLEPAPFLVCQSCATVAEGYYGTSAPIEVTA